MFIRFLAVVLLLGAGLPRPISAMPPEKDVGSGQILFQSGGQMLRAIHLRSEAEVNISGIVAHVELRQSFRNQTDSWQEAVYVMPLPETAAVNYMEMRVGDRVVRATVKEKHEARKIYQEARAAGKKAALTEQQRPNLFRQTIANIAPGETIAVLIRYAQTIDYGKRSAGEYSFRLPTTLTPRFMVEPEPGISAPFIRSDVEPERDDPVNPISISVSLTAGMPLMEIASAYHDVSVRRAEKHYLVELVAPSVSMDRDYVLSWRPETGGTPRTAVFRERLDGDDYLLMMVLPPDPQYHVQALPRDMIFVVDTSGSMQGTSIAQAKSSLIAALQTLRAEDRFNIIEFNSSWRRLFSAVQPADAYSVARATEWVNHLEADGGTHMLPALAQAVASPTEDGYLKHIVFITDGAVSNETQLFQLIHQQLGSARLFPVGIGSAPNSYFMRQAARFGRGTFTHIGNLNEVGQKMADLYQKIDSPVAMDLAIHWPGEVEAYPAKLPAVYQGEPLLVVAKAPALHGDVLVTGVTADAGWQESVSLDTEDSRPGVGLLWARRKIEALNDEEIRGRDPEAVKQEILGVGLTHSLVTRYTSLVAVEEVVSRLPADALHTAAVPNTVPHGQTFMLPRTATGMSLSFVTGLVSLLIAGGLYLVRR